MVDFAFFGLPADDSSMASRVASHVCACEELDDDRIRSDAVIIQFFTATDMMQHGPGS